MTKAPRLDRVGLRLDGVSNEQRLDLWSDITRPLFDVSALRRNIELPIKAADAWLLDNLVMMRSTFGAHIFHRQGRHTAHDVTDSLLIQIYVEGLLQGDLDGHAYAIMPGDLHVLDFSRPHLSRTTHSTALGFLISHDLVGYDRERHPREMTVSCESAVGRVVRNTILNVYQNIEAITKAEEKPIADGLVGLLRGALFSPTNVAAEPAFVAARGQTIRDYVNQHLQSDELTGDRICGKFGLSRATLFREFEADGGLRRYITARRLDAALSNLAFTDSPKGAVTRAADTWGFSSVSHFSREFKRKFGFGPGSVVGTQSRASGPAAEKPASTADNRDLLPFLRKL